MLIIHIKVSILVVIMLLVDSQGNAQQRIHFDTVSFQCFYIKQIHDNYVVNDYRKFRELWINGSDTCEQYSLPTIDFTKKTLLGYLGNSGGCSAPKVTRSIYFQNGEYTVKIQVQEQGMCRVLWDYKCWLVIDKIADERKVKFETTYVR